MKSVDQSFGTYAAAHDTPHGPGDTRPTAMQILKDEDLLSFPNRLAGKTVLITGGTSGLGLEVARALHAAGTKVFVTGRCNSTKGSEIAESISEVGLKAASKQKENDAKYGLKSNAERNAFPVRFVHIDLADLASVRDGATSFLAQSGNKLNLLVCCAGVMSPPERMTTAQGHELQFGVNHLAHFLLFKTLSPVLVDCSTEEFASRVIAVSSCAHRASSLVDNGNYDFEKTKYQPGVSYGQSKTANIFMANEIERKFSAQGLHGVSVHPGIIMETGLVRHLTDDGAKLAKQIEEGAPKFAGRPKNAQQGAGCIVWAAVSAKLEGTGGIYTEDCDVSQPVKEGNDEGSEWFEPGRADWCYDEGAAEKLWLDSEKLVKTYL